MCEPENTTSFINADEKAMRDNVPNTLIDSHEQVMYEKVGFLGNGGHSSCYEFQNTNTSVKYAFKVIPKRKGPNPNDTRPRYMAFDEAALHSKLEHENVVRLYGSFEDAHNVYLILKPCKFGTLSQVLLNRFRLTPIEARYYLRQIASGCLYLHRQLIVHRDLKVQNILIDENVTAKICHFGFASKLANASVKSNIFGGTMQFMAPEVVERRGHSLEVDAWAIGCIAYHLLVGRTPFMGANPKETINLITTGKYHPIPDVYSLPKNALSLISGALELDPSKRLTVSQILKHPFLVKPPKIPRHLPISLLSALYRDEMNVSAEEYVMEIIKTHEANESRERSKNFSRFFLRFICGRSCFGL